MNDQKPIKVLQAQLDRLIASIKAVIKKLIKKIKGESQEKKPPPKDVSAQQEMFKRVATAITSLGKGFKKTKKKPRKSKHAGSKNHNKKRNKVRAKMAVKSNRINRKRVKRWKH
jgi:Zn-dependent M32 family carboxypeptidase